MVFAKLKKGYEDAWRAIIRPPRQEYTLNDLGTISSPKTFHHLLNSYLKFIGIGPQIFFQDELCIKRTDIQIVNPKGLALQCSWYQPLAAERPLPCVIYLHGNSSSRLEGLTY
jgi:hypothetical protein